MEVKQSALLKNHIYLSYAGEFKKLCYSIELNCSAQPVATE